MGHRLHDPVRHNIWATAQVLDACRGLDQQTLDATVPGTYGTIIETLRHMIGAESSYLARLTGTQAAYPRQEEPPADLGLLTTRAAELAHTWEALLTSDADSERMGEARGGDGAVFAVPAGVFLTQALHHANEHRAHICTILGAQGHEPPDVSAWGYALATGRSTRQPGT